MRRHIYTTPLIFAVWCLVASGAVNNAHRPQSRADYHEIAQYISRRVLALRGRVSGFESINRRRHVYVWEHPFKPLISYNHAVTKWEPIRDAEPPMLRAVYATNGFTLNVWMVDGNLTWTPTKPPVKIGSYTVAVEVAGPQSARIQPLIDKIVGDAANHFNRRAQSNNSLDRSGGCAFCIIIGSARLE